MFSDIAITHYLLTFGSACVTLVLGFLLLGIRIPKSEAGLGKLRKARVYLSGAYFVLAASGFFSYLMGVEAERDEILMAFTLFIASYQALLFTATCITFIRPTGVKRSIIIKHLLAITLAGGVLVTSSLLTNAAAFPYALYTCVVLYVLQLLRYVYLFRREYRRSLEQVEAYYDEEENYRLRWVKVCFYSALGIGVWALASLFSGNVLYCLFVVAYTAYYAYMEHRFSRYMADAKFLIPALAAEPVPADTEEITKDERKHLSEKERRLQAALDSWVADREYCKPDVGMNDVALSLGTNLNFLRHYFKTVMNTDFRAWRVKLRVAEAKRLIEERPDVSLDEVCRLAGFNHPSNLHRQFENSIGMTPTAYKSSLIVRS
jgi:AraC-like DNA-binding protein